MMYCASSPEATRTDMTGAKVPPASVLVKVLYDGGDSGVLARAVVPPMRGTRGSVAIAAKGVLSR